MTVDERTTLDQLLRPYAQLAQGDLERYLVEPGVPEAMAEAMRYCALGGGKRLRLLIHHRLDYPLRLRRQFVLVEAQAPGVLAHEAPDKDRPRKLIERFP